jgi:hypothetical protein
MTLSCLVEPYIFFIFYVCISKIDAIFTNYNYWLDYYTFLESQMFDQGI